MVLDFRALNEKTIGDNYLLPNIIEILDQFGSAQYFSVFDLASGFHQIQMAEEDKHKTVFSSCLRLFMYSRIFIVLSGLNSNEMYTHFDDLVIYARSLIEHRRKYLLMADRMRKANLKLQPDKCNFLKREVLYLGHVLSREGVRLDP